MNKQTKQLNLKGTANGKALKDSIGDHNRGARAGMAVLERCQNRKPGNPKAQLAMFLGEFVIKSGTGRPRTVSEKTNTEYASNLMRMIDELAELNVRVQNLGEIGKTHAIKLMGRWVAMKYSSAYFYSKVSILRRFLTFIGKERVVPRHQGLVAWLAQHGLEAPPARQSAAERSKAWDENDVDFDEVLIKVRSVCPMTAHQLEMQAAFGLRMMESVQIRPEFDDGGTFLHVVHGTKGGLPRVVDFDKDEAVREWQRDVLERAKLAAASNKKKTLSLPGLKLSQSKNRFYNVLKKVGVTAKELGVTAHGLRHQYVARRYREITGFGVPVSSSAPIIIDQLVRDADLQAREELSRATGHFRPEITQAYSGSISLLERERTRNIRKWLSMIEENPEFLKIMAEAGIARGWLGGNFALGNKVSDTEPMRLIVATVDLSPLDPDTQFLLNQRLLALYARGVDLSVHCISHEPLNSLELNLKGMIGKLKD